MNNPTRWQELQFGLLLIAFGIISGLFTLAPSKARGEYRSMVARVFKEIGEGIKI